MTTLASDSFIVVRGGTFNNSGQFTMEGTALFFQGGGGSTFRNQAQGTLSKKGAAMGRVETGFVNDGGRFEVWNDGEILNTDNQAGKFIVQNNGVVQKYLTEYLGTTTVEIAFENNGGILNAEGSVHFAAGFSQTLPSSVTNLGIGTYQFPGGVGASVDISAGTLRLSGGTVNARQIRLLGLDLGGANTNAAFEGDGVVNAILRNFVANVSLTGNLTVSGPIWQTSGRMRLNGQTLTNTGSSLRNEGGIIELNGGTLTQTSTIGIVNEGQILRPGTINGRLQNRAGGRIVFDGGNQPDVLVVNGDLENYAGGLIELSGGTLTHTGVAGILNNGEIRGPGTINGRLRNQAGGTVRVAGGNQAGVLTLNGDFTQEVGGTLIVEIGGTTAGTTYSQLVVSGLATLGGTLAVVLLDEFEPNAGPPADEFQVLTFGSSEGAFDNEEQTIDLGDGLFLDLTYNLTNLTLVTRA
ncbi:MAG: hypothetical protein L0Z62_00910 [Gemmataceae bacterium]|nr:hypothetical protein [Gemmataceae bacterium]